MTQAGGKEDPLPVAFGLLRGGIGAAGAAAVAATGAGERPVHALFEPGREPSTSAVPPPRQSMDL